MNVFPINVPPLRERGEDILLLARRFLAEAFDSPGIAIGISPAASEILRSYPWPGNVRELKNRMIEVAVIQGTTSPNRFDLEKDMIAPLLHHLPSSTESSPLPSLPRTLKEGEKDQIRRALSEAEGNKSLAARILGISRKALYAKMREYGIEEEP